MSKKSLSRLIRIATGTFGGGRDEIFSLSESLSKFEKFVHFWVLVVRSFIRNRCPIRASALSFTTLLALIPMMAVAMSVSSALLKTQGEEKLKVFITQFLDYMVPSELSFTRHEESMDEYLDQIYYATPTTTNAVPDGSTTETNEVTSTEATDANSGEGEIAHAKREASDYIYKFIENTASGKLGALGVILLIWTTIATLTRVEETFNDIWGVARGRDWWARITNYFTTVVLIPPLCFVALGLVSGPRLSGTKEMLQDVPWLVWLLSQLLPILVICFTFALFYKLLPNTKVHFRAAFVGASLAAFAWYGFNLFSFYLASRWVSASKIYGSLALIPLLMAGLWVVWVIVLFGAQVAYAFQNRESYLQERLAENVNQRGREFVALRLMTCIGQYFDRGLPPATVSQMSRELGIPSKLVQQVLCTLLAARLVVEVSGTEPGYAPARPLNTINCHHILLAMRATQGQELVTREEPVREEVYGEFARIQSAEKEAATSMTMLALVNRAEARLQLAAPLVAAPKENKKAAPVQVTELPQEPATATAPEPEPEPEKPALEKAQAEKPKPESQPFYAIKLPTQPKPKETQEDDDQSFPL